MGTKECGYRRPHLLLPSPQVGGSVQPLAEPPCHRCACHPLGLPWSPGYSHCLPLAPLHRAHPGLRFKPHLIAGLEEVLEKKSPKILQPGKPPSSAQPHPLPATDTAAKGVGRAQVMGSGWGWLKYQVHCVPVCLFKNRLLFGAVLGLQQN